MNRSRATVQTIMRYRVSMVGTALLLGLQCAIWLVAGWLGWSLRDLMVGPGSPQSDVRARFAVAIFAGATANALVLGLFLVRQNGWAWWIVLAMQILDLAVATAAAILVNQWWWLISGVAAATLLLLFVNRGATAKPAQG